MSEEKQAVTHKAHEESSEVIEYGQNRIRVKHFRPTCGAPWVEGSTQMQYGWAMVDCPKCNLARPLTEPVLPSDATQRLMGMSVNDRLVLRDWFAGSEHYADLVTYIDKLNADTMAQYGAAPKEESNG
jgi:hypothetical protein